MSCLPSFAACRTSRLLQDIEDLIVCAVVAGSWNEASNKNLLSRRSVSNYARSLFMWFEYVDMFLVVVVNLLPQLCLICPAEINTTLCRLGTETLLIDLPKLTRNHLQLLSVPVRLKPPNQCKIAQDLHPILRDLRFFWAIFKNLLLGD